MATASDIVFFGLIALSVVGGGLGVLFVRRLVHATLLLALVLLGVAGAFLLLGSEVLAAVQLLIYVGAIITLILFTIMFTYEDESLPDIRMWERQKGGGS